MPGARGCLMDHAGKQRERASREHGLLFLVVWKLPRAGRLFSQEATVLLGLWNKVSQTHEVPATSASQKSSCSQVMSEGSWIPSQRGSNTGIPPPRSPPLPETSLLCPCACQSVLALIRYLSELWNQSSLRRVPTFPSAPPSPLAFLITSCCW